jgi:exodeoxyribonuclease VII small subunit
MAAVKKVKKQTFEEAIAELEATVAKLEQEEVTLDESLELFSRGVELSGICRKILDDIEGRIVKLVENGDGSVREEAF